MNFYFLSGRSKMRVLAIFSENPAERSTTALIRFNAICRFLLSSGFEVRLLFCPDGQAEGRVGVLREEIDAFRPTAIIFDNAPSWAALKEAIKACASPRPIAVYLSVGPR